MNAPTASNKLAKTSLILGIIGWVFYIGQWCFDFTIGFLLSVVTAGSSAIFATILDVLPFVLWLVGIITGHVALGQMKRNGASGRGKAVWGLILSYSGLFFFVFLTIILVALVAALIAVGIHAGWLEKIIHLLPFMHGQPSQ